MCKCKVGITIDLMHPEIQKTIQQPHWKYIYRRRKQVLGISTKQMATSQVFSLIGSIIAGVLLDANKESLALIVGVFVVLPGVFDLDGSIGASLSAKINHQLEDPDRKPADTFWNTVSFALLLCASAGALVGLTGAAVSALFFDAYFWHVFFIGWGAVMLSGLIGFPIIALMSIFFRLRKINPDDVVGPIESSLFDILTIITIVIMARLIV